VEPNAIAVVLNPAAGGGKALQALPRVEAALRSLGRPYVVYKTAAAGDGRAAAARLAKEGASLVLAVGGDGTFHEVANGMYDSGTKVPFGIVPAGNGIDFARTTGASKKVEDAVAAACTTTPRAIDAGLASFDDGTTRLFLNVAGMGFDALVAEQAVRWKFLPGANLPYLAAALQSLFGFKNIPVEVEVDGRVIATPAVFVQIANAKYMGGGYKIAPMADIEDAHLDLALVGDLSKPDLLLNIPKVYGGKHVSHPKFQHVRAKSVRVVAKQPARVQLDGELLGKGPVTFTVLPAALMFAG
jgi:YegS/Rv2252/BmrU family lipid kinase